MAVSGISGNAVGYVSTSKAATPKPPPQSAAPLKVTTPAATVEISPQALAAAASPTKPQSPSTGGAPVPATSAPKVNTTKVALKEANEPLTLLTKQAKHGDQVAKLLLKKIEKKEASAQSEPGSSAANTAAATEEGSETEETNEHGGAEKAEAPEHAGSNESTGVAEVADSGENQETDQHG